MLGSRIVPCLLLSGSGLVKTKKFRNPVYLGDPVNAVKIFSEKEADELVLLDINASREGREPDYDLIAEIAGECFMPISYGGGVRTLSQARRLIKSGVEKIIINSAAVCESTAIISEVATMFGSQAVIGAIDVQKTFFGNYRIYAKGATVAVDRALESYLEDLVISGAGEILINSIDRDGTMGGYDISLVRRVSSTVGIPVIACGGAGTIEHLREAVHVGGASAAAAGSMFVFHGKRNAVLINYPTGIQL